LSCSQRVFLRGLQAYGILEMTAPHVIAALEADRAKTRERNRKNGPLRDPARVRQHIANWRLRNQDKDLEYRARWRRKRRGAEAPTRPRPELCDCCGNPPITVALAEDHDKQTGRFRGWLCLRCNTGIGLLGDNLDGVGRAKTYLSSRVLQAVPKVSEDAAETLV
jgi:hypothetical protein